VRPAAAPDERGEEAVPKSRDDLQRLAALGLGLGRLGLLPLLLLGLALALLLLPEPVGLGGGDVDAGFRIRRLRLDYGRPAAGERRRATRRSCGTGRSSARSAPARQPTPSR